MDHNGKSVHLERLERDEGDGREMTCRMSEEAIEKLQIQLRESNSREQFWKKEADDAKKNLRMTRQLVKRIHGLGHVDVDDIVQMCRDDAYREVESTIVDRVKMVTEEWQGRLAAMKEEYESSIAELEETIVLLTKKHRHDMDQVMHDRGRLDSALQYIKEMTLDASVQVDAEEEAMVGACMESGGKTQTNNTQCTNEIEVEHLTDSAFSVQRELENDESSETCQEEEAMEASWQEGREEDASSGKTDGTLVSPAGLQNARRAVVPVDAAEQGYIRDSKNENDQEPKYTRSSPRGRVETRKENRCGIIDYNGEIPGVVTENSMARILEGPQGNPHFVRSSNISKNFNIEENNRASCSGSWRIPSLLTRSNLFAGISELEGHLKRRQSIPRPNICEASQKYDDAKDLQSPVKTPQRRAYERSPSNCSDFIQEDSFSRVIRALGNASPATANILTQHVSDSWAVKASSDPNSPVTVAKNVEIKQRSSFLSRIPISLDSVLQTASSHWTR